MKKLFTAMVLLAISFLIISQDKQTSPKEMFLEAESNFLYEEYSEALPSYLKLYKADTSNYNICYKAGVCFLNIPYEKTRSIEFLEKASRNITNDYNPNSLKESNAPLDALFYLGNAYRINNQLDKALDTYNKFKKVLDPLIFDEQLVNEQIKSIERARKYQKSPIFFSAKNVGETLNSKFAESNAVVSGDESTLVYNVKLQFYDALFYSIKENGQWSAPINIIPDLGVDGDVYATGLSFDGKELLIYRSDNYDGNLYVTRFANGKWSAIKKLNDNINTKYWESHASLSADGLVLYFTSNRKGSYGDLDIFTASRSDIASDNWINVRNIGPEVNTPFNEETPFVSADGEILYFSSYGHFNMGGYDVFYSTLLENGKWSTPLTMGYPFNTTDDDLFFCPIRNGELGYVCRYYPENGNYGKTDIYEVEVYTKEHPRKFILKGILSLSPEIKDYKNINLTAKIVNKATHDTLQTLLLDPLKQKFDTKLTAGNYELIIEGNGIKRSSEDFSININQKSNEVSVNSTLTATKKVEKAEIVTIKPIAFEKNFYKVTNSDKIAIKLNLDKNSIVTVNITNENGITKQEKINIKHIQQKYYFIPEPGRTVLKFSSTSPNGQISEGEVVVYYQEPIDISDPEIAKRIQEKQQELNYAKLLLSEFAKGSLLIELNTLDLSKENIQSLNELLDYLKHKSITSTYSEHEVDSLFDVFSYYQPEAAKLLIDAYNKVSDNNLRPYITLLNSSEAKKNVPEAINFLIKECKSNSKAYAELYEKSRQLSDFGNAFYYYTALKKVTSGNLRLELDSLDLSAQKIRTPDELLNYLLKQAQNSGYSSNDVFKGFLLIPAFTPIPAELLAAITALAGSEMLTLLNSIDLNKENIKSTEELGMLLYSKCKEQNLDLKELLKLYFQANSANQFKLFVKEIETLASGNIRNIIKNPDFISNNPQTIDGFTKQLQEFAHDQQSKEDLTRLFAFIASHNLIKLNRFEPAKIEEATPINYSKIGIIALSGLVLITLAIFVLKRKKNKLEA
jgi:hypothetical protein